MKYLKRFENNGYIKTYFVYNESTDQIDVIMKL